VEKAPHARFVQGNSFRRTSLNPGDHGATRTRKSIRVRRLQPKGGQEPLRRESKKADGWGCRDEYGEVSYTTKEETILVGKKDAEARTKKTWSGGDNHLRKCDLGKRGGRVARKKKESSTISSRDTDWRLACVRLH